MRALELFKKFSVYTASLEKTRSKMEKLATEQQLSRGDIERVYEGLFLGVFARMEVLLEELFFGLLVGGISCHSCDAVRRVDFSSEKIAREVILRERKYLEWLPYGKTEELAKAFFRGGRPFTKLDDGDKSRLQKCVYIRNAIAHKSRHANSTFKDKVIGSTPLTPRERTPAGFLRSQYRVTPSETRFQLYMTQSLSLMHKLCVR
jgi:hypothetical protein